LTFIVCRFVVADTRRHRLGVWGGTGHARTTAPTLE